MDAAAPSLWAMRRSASLRSPGALVLPTVAEARAAARARTRAEHNGVVSAVS